VRDLHDLQLCRLGQRFSEFFDVACRWLVVADVPVVVGQAVRERHRTACLTKQRTATGLAERFQDSRFPHTAADTACV
jgi:hypothetical protein